MWISGVGMAGNGEGERQAGEVVSGSAEILARFRAGNGNMILIEGRLSLPGPMSSAIAPCLNVMVSEVLMTAAKS